VFAPFKAQYARDNANYDATCNRNKANGALGGRPKNNPSGYLNNPNNPSGYLETQPNPKEPDSDSDSDRDNERDSKNESFKKEKEKKEKNISSDKSEAPKKKSPTKYSEGIWKAACSVYDNFLFNRTGVEGKWEPVEGKSLGLILDFIITQVLKRHKEFSVSEAEAKAVDTFEHILSGWDNLEPFLQNQMTLKQINTNIINIINQVKNKSNGKPNATTERHRLENHLKELLRE